MKRNNSTRFETLESRVVLSANIVTAGDPDVAFGNMGRAVIDLGNQNDSVSDLLGLPGGATLVLGGHFDTGSQPVSTLVSLDAAGAVDGTFGSNGVITIDGPGVSTRSILMTPGGQLLVGGNVRGPGGSDPLAGGEDFLLLRLNADGTPDAAFGATGTGRVTTDAAGRQDVAVKVLQQDDGRIIVAGYEQRLFLARVLQTPHIVVARYLPNGTPDATFGSGGVVVTDLPGFGAERAASAAIQPDGKVVVVGSAIRTEGDGSLGRGDPPQVLVMRYRADGTLDDTFGDEGVVVTPYSGAANDVRVTDNGGILLAGNITIADHTVFAAMRFDADGSPDRTFGRRGVAAVRFARLAGDDDELAIAHRLALQPDGKAVLAGRAGNDAVVLARLLPGGRPDRHFGDFGRAVYDAPVPVGTVGLATQADGKIITAADAADVTLTRVMPETVKSFASLSGGTLRVRGTPAADAIRVAPAAAPAFRILSVFMGGYEQRFVAFEVQRVVIDAGAGNDTVSVEDLYPSTIRGGDGDDTITGSTDADRIDGGRGDDVITGRAGTDRIAGGAGADTIFARDEEIDVVIGGVGQDSAQLDEDDRVAGIESV